MISTYVTDVRYPTPSDFWQPRKKTPKKSVHPPLEESMRKKLRRKQEKLFTSQRLPCLNAIFNAELYDERLHAELYAIEVVQQQIRTIQGTCEGKIKNCDLLKLYSVEVVQGIVQDREKFDSTYQKFYQLHTKIERNRCESKELLISSIFLLSIAIISFSITPLLAFTTSLFFLTCISTFIPTLLLIAASKTDQLRKNYNSTISDCRWEILKLLRDEIIQKYEQPEAETILPERKPQQPSAPYEEDQPKAETRLPEQKPQPPSATTKKTSLKRRRDCLNENLNRHPPLTKRKKVEDQKPQSQHARLDFSQWIVSQSAATVGVER